MLALSRSRLMEMSERPAVGSGNRDTDFNLPSPSLVSSPLTESLKEVSFLKKICPFNLSSDNHENDNNLTILNARNQIYLPDRYRD